MMTKIFCLPVALMLIILGCDDGSNKTDIANFENTHELCHDGLDNDGDSAADCDDIECNSFCQDTEEVFEPDTEDTWHNKPNRGEVIDPGTYVVDEKKTGSFGLVSGNTAVPIIVSSEDYEGVIRVAEDLKTDIEKVTGKTPSVHKDKLPSTSQAVIIGTVGKSPLIDEMIKNEKLDVSDIEGKWETFVITSVDSPIDDLDRALVIVGSDQRGTIFGVYDLCAQIGVSPWHFWADVPPLERDELYVISGRHSQGEPAVKYRGIFINDENPALDLWHRNYFSDEGYAFKKGIYAKIFEAMLRIKANYLWPAVWGRAFAEDDAENHAEAKRYGIVMGTSHEAPMMRGIEEWNRGVKTQGGKPFSDAYGGNGEWSYRTNKDAVEAYWRDGIKYMAEEDFEGVVTIGMRGPGDVALSSEDGIPLVNDFISSQRNIIEEVMGVHPAKIPQVWTLYKEVQDWWESGLRVPGDVTVVWADDNWGNMRMLPDHDEPERPGGYGLYYHFDYVGGPRCYKWVDTNLLPNIWEQLHLSYELGVDRLWVVNVGDMKGNELPTQFFMDYAWNPERWPVERLHEWEEMYAGQQFGSEHAVAAADILRRYSMLQSDRKPELTNRKDDSTGSPFSLTNYREMERVTAEWQKLADDAKTLADRLDDKYQDAYYQLVLYQVKASALMYELRLAGFKNRLYVKQGRASALDMAAIAQERFEQSTAMADYYNNELSNGKWKGFQTQPYLGYSGWQQPEENGAALKDFIYPSLETVEIPEAGEMGIAVDGSEDVYPDSNVLVLPTFSPYQVQPAQYIEVFNRGTEGFEFEITVSPEVPWLTVSPSTGIIDENNKQIRAELTVNNWSEVPEGSSSLTITVTNLSDFTSVDLEAVIDNPQVRPSAGLFVESNGYVSMEADNYSRAINSSTVTWERIPDIGRTGSAMTPFPVTMNRVTPGEGNARLEYDMHLFSTGEVTVYIYLSPRQNVLHTDGLTFALSMDDSDPTSINITKTLDPLPYPEGKRGWERGVADNVHIVSNKFAIAKAGKHTLKLWAVDPTVIVQKIVLDTGGLQESYLGPPESSVSK